MAISSVVEAKVDFAYSASILNESSELSFEKTLKHFPIATPWRKSNRGGSGMSRVAAAGKSSACPSKSICSFVPFCVRVWMVLIRSSREWVCLAMRSLSQL